MKFNTNNGLVVDEMNYGKLCDSAWKALTDVAPGPHDYYLSIPDEKLKIKKFATTVVDGFITGGYSYTGDEDYAIIELRDWFHRYAGVIMPLAAIKKYCDEIVIFCRHYPITLDTEFGSKCSDIGIDAKQDTEKGDFCSDCWESFKEINHIDLSTASKVEANNLRELVVWYGAHFLKHGYMVSDGIIDTKMTNHMDEYHDFVHLVTLFAGYEFKSESVWFWINWLDTRAHQL